MAPENDNGMSLWPLLHDAIVRALPVGASKYVRVFPCDLDGAGAFVRFAGTEIARAALRESDGEADGRPAILIVGLFPSPRADAVSPREQAAAALLEWTGARYLRYGFDRKTLKKAADAAIRGAEQPPPRVLRTTAEEVRRRISEARHWLENRLRNIDGAQVALDTALRGEATLHEAHLEPVAAMTNAQSEMMGRLWAVDGPVARLAPEIGGLGAVRDRMNAYERRWDDLERARAALRTAPDAKENDRLAAMQERLLAVREALAAAIEAMDVLDGKLSVVDEA